jgi:porin
MLGNRPVSLLCMVTVMLMLFMSGTACLADDQAASAADEGLLPVPDYSGDLWARSHLTGDWGGLRQDWADHGVTMEFDWYQAYQDVVDGGIREGSESSTNLDYRLKLDLMRMGVVPGALVTVRAQSRFGDTVNGASGLLLPVNMYSAFPFSSDSDGDVDFTITELNWTQFLSEKFGLLAGKITTTATANEFMGGEGRSQFMNMQLSFSANIAQLAPYSTLAVGALWMPNPNWTVTTLFINLEDASTTSGFDDIGDGTTWATTVDYLGSLNELPGGGSFAFYYGFDADFAQIGGLNFDPGTGVSIDSQSDAWAISWSGWQYLFSEEGSGAVDPRNGRQDLQGLGVFAQLGIADEDTNPVSWSITGGLSGRGSIPGRDADTWGVGYFYNELQDLDRRLLVFEDSVSGVEAYYDIALSGWASLTLDAQWLRSAIPSVDDATILGARLNVSF